MPGVGKNGRIKKTADVNRQGHRELQRNKRNNNYTGILYMYVRTLEERNLESNGHPLH